MTKKIIILGSTGSIGTQTLEVVDKLKDFEIVALSGGKNIELLKQQIKKYNPKIVCVQQENDIKKIKDEFKVETLCGEEGLVELAKYSNYDILVVATSGVVALRAVICAINNKKTVALANKETLVMAGDIVMNLAHKQGVDIIPIDSEHSAILQCMDKNKEFAKRIWITASGGPFLNNSRDEMKNFSVQDALNHPKWAMGKKITVDCATLVNKGLEVIEAHHLFNFSYDNIKVVIHPQSIVHSFVEFVDGSFLAQMGLPSMHIPIQYALTYPKRLEGIKTDSFNIYNNKLEFLEPDYKKFPLLKLALDCARIGGSAPVVFNAINEVVVNKFLDNRIKFLDIEKIISETIEKTDFIKNPSLDEIFEIDKMIRKDFV